MVRVLLIEGDPVAADVLETLLLRMGHEVERADDGEQGVERFRAGRFDLVVTDLWLPRKSGLETIAELRALDPAVKLIAISGGHPLLISEGSLSAALCLGADATLSKPFSGAELSATIARLLGGERGSSSSP